MADLHDQLRGYWKLQRDAGNGWLILDTLNPTARDLKRFGLVGLDRFIGSDRKMSNYPTRKRRGRKGGIKYNVNSAGAKIRFVPAGMWGLIQGSHPPTRDLIGPVEKKVEPYFLKHFDKQVRRRLRI